jgi:hypothetical protein
MFEQLQSQWALISALSIVVGAALSWLFTRKMRASIQDASRETIDAYKGALAAQETLASRQADVSIATIAAITKERDDYRTLLQELRGKLQAAELRILELEQRPNFANLTALIEGQSLMIKSILSALTLLTPSIEKLAEKNK